jgi:hypothetical protein
MTATFRICQQQFRFQVVDNPGHLEQALPGNQTHRPLSRPFRPPAPRPTNNGAALQLGHPYEHSGLATRNDRLQLHAEVPLAEAVALEALLNSSQWPPLLPSRKRPRSQDPPRGVKHWRAELRANASSELAPMQPHLPANCGSRLAPPGPAIPWPRLSGEAPRAHSAALARWGAVQPLMPRQGNPNAGGVAGPAEVPPPRARAEARGFNVPGMRSQAARGPQHQSGAVAALPAAWQAGGVASAAALHSVRFRRPADLRFPGPGALLERCVSIQDQYPTLQQYKDAMTAALLEELYLRFASRL